MHKSVIPISDQFVLPAYAARLVGFNFRNVFSERELNALRGDEISLELEPSNPHDRNAIKCIARGHHFGYVDRQSAQSLAPRLNDSEGAVVVIESRSSSVFHITVTMFGGDYEIGLRQRSRQERYRSHLKPALYSAAEKGDLSALNMLREEVDSAIADSRQESQDGRPVILAAENGHTEVVKWLVARGYCFNADNNRAISAAAGSGNKDLLAYLIEAGVSSKGLLQAFCVALEASQVESANIIEPLIDFKAAISFGLRNAYARGDYYAMSLFLHHGCAERTLIKLLDDCVLHEHKGAADILLQYSLSHADEFSARGIHSIIRVCTMQEFAGDLSFLVPMMGVPLLGAAAELLEDVTSASYLPGINAVVDWILESPSLTDKLHTSLFRICTENGMEKQLFVLLNDTSSSRAIDGAAELAFKCGHRSLAFKLLSTAVYLTQNGALTWQQPVGLFAEAGREGAPSYAILHIFFKEFLQADLVVPCLEVVPTVRFFRALLQKNQISPLVAMEAATTRKKKLCIPPYSKRYLTLQRVELTRQDYRSVALAKASLTELGLPEVVFDKLRAIGVVCLLDLKILTVDQLAMLAGLTRIERNELDFMIEEAGIHS